MSAVNPRPIPAPALSPDRAALAAAITRLGEAEAYVERVNRASEDAEAARRPLYAAVEAAEEALAAAESHAPRLRLASLMGDPVTETTPAEAKAALTAAKAALDAAYQDRDLIATEWHRAMAAVAAARDARDRLVVDVVKSAPGGDALVAEFSRVCARARDLMVTIKLVYRDWPRDGLLQTDAPSPDLVDDWVTADPAWVEAIAALHIDAATPLPGDDPDRPLEAA